MDIHEYLLEKGVRQEGIGGVRYLYHDPCHSPLKQHDAQKTVNGLLATADGARIAISARCCGEAGTLAIARPDISTQVRFRKQEELQLDSAKIHGDGYEGPIKVLTSCPSCLQGLQRYKETISELDADYIVVELARHHLGEDWMQRYVASAAAGGIERILV
jgi:Fe-S oxidoreductase